MRKKAYAKINISLDVIGKRDDGYHLLEMIMQTIDLYDEIEIIKNYDKSIKIHCNKQYVPCDERNLAYKAAKLFKDKYKIKDGVIIKIKKNIPVAAGLAGGSTDAATVLCIMNKMFNVGATYREFTDLALKIGADVPYCINGGTALCEGIGEKITYLDKFENKILVVIKPNFGVPTKEIYGSLDINKIYKHVKTNQLIECIKKDDIYGVCNNMKNVLENVTLGKHKILKEIKEDLNKNSAIGAMMSGSGPTIFGFFEDMLTAQNAYESIKNKYKFKDIFITRTINR